MQKPPTRTHGQTAVGELGPVLAATMSNDHNYILYITFNSTECGNTCLYLCIRDRIIVLGCLAVVRIIIVLVTEYCTCIIYGLMNGLL